MELFDPYAHALASLALWAILVPVLAAMSTVGRSADRSPCGKPVRDYADPVYRRERAFQNAIEMSGPFIAATSAAILAGAAPFWVNLFASIFIVARLAMVAIHVGTTIQPARSAAWMVSLLCVLALAVMGLWGALT